MSTSDIYAERNAIVQRWGKQNLAAIKAEAKGLGIRSYTGAFYRYLRAKYFRNGSKINGIGYAMPRHAIFVHKGVGRGYPIEAVNGGVLGQTKSKTVAALRNKGYNKTAIAHYLQKQSKSSPLKGKGRKPKAWFNPVIERSLPQLANEVASTNADILANNIFID